MEEGQDPNWGCSTKEKILTEATIKFSQNGYTPNHTADILQEIFARKLIAFTGFHSLIPVVM
jgi:hypothetical protein